MDVRFEPQDILDVVKASLYNNLKRSLLRYMEMSRPEWLMHKNPTSGEHCLLRALVIFALHRAVGVGESWNSPRPAGARRFHETFGVDQPLY